ncbi:MAG: hypothetical protein WA431_13185, partial [Candidatus Cybelea sp.]
MLLEARSLVLEHRYHAMRMNTHNIRLHDFGTVCGLRVDKHPSPQCVNTCAILRPGLALDCCGREIVVPEDLFVPLVDGATSGWGSSAFSNPNPPPALPAGTPSTTPAKLYIYLQYAQCDTDPIPTYVRACGCCTPCEHNGCTPSVTREGYEVLVSSTAPVDWINPLGKAFCEWLEVKLKGPGSSPLGQQLYNETLEEALCTIITEPCADFCSGGNDRLLLATVIFNSDGTLTNIDNVTGRRLVLSTGAIVEALECLAKAEIACCAATDAYLTLGATAAPSPINLGAKPPDDTITYTVTVTNTDASKEANSFNLTLAFQSKGLAFSAASFTIAGVAQPAPTGDSSGVTVVVPKLTAKAFAQLDVTAMFEPGKHEAGDTLVSVATISNYDGAHDPDVTVTTPFVDIVTDGPRVLLTGWLAKGTPGSAGDIVVIESAGAPAQLLREGMTFEFTEAMDTASAISATSTTKGSVTVVLTDLSGTAATIPCAMTWNTPPTKMLVKAAKGQLPEGRAGEGTLEITLSGGSKGDGAYAGFALEDSSQQSRLDGYPATGGDIPG